MYEKIKSPVPVIAFQIKGSHDYKKFPDEQIRNLIRDLSKHFIVILIDSQRFEIEELPQVLNYTGTLRLSELFATIGNVNAVCTHDSSLLWIAHCSNTPTLIWLAQTPPETRISLFPEKDKIYPVLCYEKVNCQPCFYTAISCKGKMSCVKELDYQWLFSETLKGLKLIIS